VVSENNKPTELAKINFIDKISKAMDNLHVRPNFNLSKKKVNQTPQLHKT
jgi:hypothetical protein